MLTANASLSLLLYYRCTKVNWIMDPTWQYGLCLCQRNAQFKLSELNWIYSQNFIIQIWLAFWVIVLMVEDKMIPIPTNFILYMSMCQMGIIMPICQVSMENDIMHIIESSFTNYFPPYLYGFMIFFFL